LTNLRYGIGDQNKDSEIKNLCAWVRRSGTSISHQTSCSCDKKWHEYNRHNFMVGAGQQNKNFENRNLYPENLVST